MGSGAEKEAWKHGGWASPEPWGPLLPATHRPDRFLHKEYRPSGSGLESLTTYRMAPVACGVRQGTGPRKHPLGGTEEGHGISHGPQSSPPVELWRKAPSGSSPHQGRRIPSQTQKAAIGPSQARERGGIPRKASGQNGVRVGQAQHLLGVRGRVPQPCLQQKQGKHCQKFRFGGGRELLRLGSVLFPIEKTTLIKNLFDLSKAKTT